MPWRISNKENKQDELCNSSSLLPGENHQGAVQEGVTRQSLLLRSTASAAKSLQSCSTLCDPIDGSPPGSCVHGIFQARVLEWGVIASDLQINIQLCEDQYRGYG